MKKLILVGLLVITSGCARLTVKDYDHGHASEDQFDRDSASCEMEGEKNSASSDSRSDFNRVFDPCMRSKGYKQK